MPTYCVFTCFVSNAPRVTEALSLLSSPQENIFTIPNLLSLSRIALSPLLGYLVLSEKYMLAFGLFALASVSDMVSLPELIALHLHCIL